MTIKIVCNYKNKISLFFQVGAGSLFIAACSSLPGQELHHSQQLITLGSTYTEEDVATNSSDFLQKVFEAASTNNKAKLIDLHERSRRMNPPVNVTRISDEEGNMSLHYAASNGANDVIEWLIAVDPGSINLTNNRHESALHVAVFGKHTGSIERLLQAGASLLGYGSLNKSPVYDAVKGGDLPTLERLFFYLPCKKFIVQLMDKDPELAGLKLDYMPPKYEYLFSALMKFQNKVKGLCTISKSKEEFWGDALKDLKNAFSSFTGNESIFSYHGLVHLEDKLKRFLDDDRTKSTIHLNSDELYILGQPSEPSNLFKKGGPMAIFFHKHRYYLREYANQDLPWSFTDISDCPLRVIELFAEAGNTELVKLCILSGSKLWDPNSTPSTPLLLAIQKGHEELVEYLLPLTRNEVERVRANNEEAYQYLRKKLTLAIETGTTKKMLALFLSYWPAIFKTDRQRRYVCLSNAISSKEPEYFEEMLSLAGVKLLKDDKKGIELFKNSIEFVNSPALRRLLESGANPDPISPHDWDDDSIRPFYYACYKEPAMALMLLDHGAEFDEDLVRKIYRMVGSQGFFNELIYQYHISYPYDDRPSPNVAKQMPILVDILHKENPDFPAEVIRRGLRGNAPIPLHAKKLYADLLIRYRNINRLVLNIFGNKSHPDVQKLGLKRLMEPFNQGPDDNWVLRYMRNQLPPFPYMGMSERQLAVIRSLIQEQFNHFEYDQLIHKAVNESNYDWIYILTGQRLENAQQYEGYKRNNSGAIGQEQDIHPPVNKKRNSGSEAPNNPKE